MYDRKLTFLGMALLGITLILYYVEGESGFQYVYVTGVAMLAVFLYTFVRFNLRYLGSGKK